MRKLILAIICIALLIIISLAIFILNPSVKSFFNQKNNLGNLDKGDENENIQNIGGAGAGDTGTEISGGGETTSPGGSGGGAGGGSGSGSGGGGGGGGKVISDDKNKPIIIPSSCVLVRPGNLPNIDCSVNYLKNSSLSLKIKNSLGEKIDIILRVDTCTPTLNGTIENNQEQNFVFSCTNKNTFNEAIYVTYLLSGNKRVDISGFVSGSAED